MSKFFSLEFPGTLIEVSLPDCTGILSNQKLFTYCNETILNLFYLIIIQKRPESSVNGSVIATAARLTAAKSPKYAVFNRLKEIRL